MPCKCPSCWADTTQTEEMRGKPITALVQFLIGFAVGVEFLKLSKEMIDRYAEALNVTAEDLVNIEKIRELKYEN